jgi:hypothetical protein
MKIKSKSLAAIALAGLFSGAVIAPNAFAGEHASEEGTKKEAKESCGGSNGCGGKDKADASHTEKGKEKNSCGGEHKKADDHKKDDHSAEKHEH